MDRRERMGALAGLGMDAAKEQLIESVAANTLAIAFPPLAPLVPFVDALLHPQRLFRQLTHPSEWLGAIEGFFGFGGGPPPHKVAIDQIIKNIKVRAGYAHRVVAFVPRVKAADNPAVTAKYNELVRLVGSYPVIRDNKNAGRFKDATMKVAPYPDACATQARGWCDPERAKIAKRLQFQMRVLGAMLDMLGSKEYKLRLEGEALVTRTELARTAELKHRALILGAARMADARKEQVAQQKAAAALAEIKKRNALALAAAQEEARITIEQARALAEKIAKVRSAVKVGHPDVSVALVAQHKRAVRVADVAQQRVRRLMVPASKSVPAAPAPAMGPVGWVALAGGVLALVARAA